ncbi:hypothetical protein QAD02_013329 [Eretmocerus hayati]|uniref:Uncharacterized protein n=1 Tax=Eretmocerus hayati TaxID=131215 RepID=A0ACC2P2D8_9HYME|nr:hypothetical protein QAD02_013329 [Eretmocerus hayati]
MDRKSASKSSLVEQKCGLDTRSPWLQRILCGCCVDAEPKLIVFSKSPFHVGRAPGNEAVINTIQTADVQCIFKRDKESLQWSVTNMAYCMTVNMDTLYRGATALLTNGLHVQIGQSTCESYIFLSTGSTKMDRATSLGLAIDMLISMNTNAEQQIKSDFDTYEKESAGYLKDLSDLGDKRAILVAEKGLIMSRMSKIDEELEKNHQKFLGLNALINFGKILMKEKHIEYTEKTDNIMREFHRVFETYSQSCDLYENGRAGQQGA